MNEQILQKANVIQSRIKELEKNLENIERIERDIKDGRRLEFEVSADGYNETELMYEFLPINTDAFLSEYKGYLNKELDKQRNLFSDI